MKKIFDNSITFTICILINTMILLGFAISIFFVIDTIHAQIENSTNDDDHINKPTNDTQQQQQVIETQCKSPCPPNAEMCIEMCA